MAGLATLEAELAEAIRSVSSRHSSELRRGLVYLQRVRRTQGEGALLSRRDFERLLGDTPASAAVERKQGVFVEEAAAARRRALEVREGIAQTRRSAFTGWAARKVEAAREEEHRGVGMQGWYVAGKGAALTPVVFVGARCAEGAGAAEGAQGAGAQELSPLAQDAVGR